ncbi:AB hydrolase-1 domain-containing protein [Aphelenchoides bicaudatus]|nr:AB hydrolase-1 domain-containing protein [Aphelenchoides bicaudatus]
MGSNMSRLHTNAFFGPELYSTYSPKRQYGANFFESMGNKMIYSARVVESLLWTTSPILTYYVLTRYHLYTINDCFAYAQMIFAYLFIGYFTRFCGRHFNPLYSQFIADYSVGVEQFRKGQMITKNSPVSFVAKPNPNLWYIEPPAHNLHGSMLKIWLNKIAAYCCVHTFGRRMLYPGSLCILKTLLFQHVCQNRLKLILEMNGERWQIQSTDGNIIDGILFNRREPFPDAPLIICCDGNGGFYETGILKTPAEMNYSVLGFNPPGFSESTGAPHAPEVSKKRTLFCLVGRIGGFPATWAAANYPNIRGIILDASFDHVLPLAQATMPNFASEVVETAIYSYFNLDVAGQLEKYNGPVRIVRRYNDEVVTSYHGPNELRRRRENRGNYLLLRFLKGRYPDVMRTEEDDNAVFNYLEISGFGEERHAVDESGNSLQGYDLDFVLENSDLRQHLIRLLCFMHFHDVQATHVTPLKTDEFILPEAVNFTDNFTGFLQSFR